MNEIIYYFLAASTLLFIAAAGIIIYQLTILQNKMEERVFEIFNTKHPLIARLESLELLVGTKGYSWNHANNLINRVASKRLKGIDLYVR